MPDASLLPQPVEIISRHAVLPAGHSEIRSQMLDWIELVHGTMHDVGGRGRDLDMR